MYTYGLMVVVDNVVCVMYRGDGLRMKVMQ
jgi:hypothetical protein